MESDAPQSVSTENDPETPGNEGATIDALESRLKEKEKLVAALTKRLHQAAEQLDRIHRTGGDKSLRVASGGIPAELIDEQKHLVEDLQSAVTQWTDSQPTETLARIESQVNELRSLLASGAGANLEGLAASPAEPAPAPASKPSNEGSSPAAPEDDQPLSNWEALKASMMDGQPASLLEDSAEPSTIDSGANAPEPPSGEAVVTMSTADIPPLPDLPGAVDTESASIEELRAAVEERDNCIETLMKRLRVAEARHVQKVDWESLQDTPDELRARLEDLETQLKDTLRVAEVELSIEKARLGRKESELAQLEETLEKKRRILGVEITESGEMTVAPEEEETKGRSWLGMLGLQDDD